MAPTAHLATVAWGAARPVEAAVEPDLDADAAALAVPLAVDEVPLEVPLAFPALVRADAVTPVEFVQWELYSSVESVAEVKVMSAH